MKGSVWITINRQNGSSYGGWSDFPVAGLRMGVWEGTHWRTGVVPFDIIAGHRESSLTMSKCSLSCPSGQAYIQVNSGVDQTPARSPALPLGLC